MGLKSLGADQNTRHAIEAAYSQLYERLILRPEPAMAFAAGFSSSSVSNIVGLGVGRANPHSGSADDFPYIRVLVREKFPRDQLPEQAQIPKSVHDVAIYVDEWSGQLCQSIPGSKS